MQIKTVGGRDGTRGRWRVGELPGILGDGGGQDLAILIVLINPPWALRRCERSHWSHALGPLRGGGRRIRILARGFVSIQVRSVEQGEDGLPDDVVGEEWRHAVTLILEDTQALQAIKG